MHRVLLAVWLLIGALLPLAGQAQTQDPWGTWSTIETARYRLHYPAQAEPWALTVAAQLEPIRDRVTEEVGFAPEQKVDVVVMDPLRMSNGFALPFTGTPRMALFATPPQASSVLGWYRSWAEELVVHEDAHLVHLLRPSRQPTLRAVGRAIGVTPMTTNAPAWVVEGYATVVEGRLTGMGRPNGDFRALLLRRLAEQGELPTYPQLDASGRWMGGAFRYLVGSAYLEWLEERTHEGALRDLWARMTARRARSFDEAFEGVFGDDSRTLYARFTAEVTHAAMELEQARPVDEDTLWLDRSWTTGAPALSPDGERIAFVAHQSTGPARIEVYETGDQQQALEEWRDDVEEMLAEDPQDVAPVQPEVFPRTPVATRIRNARHPGDPRWTPDGEALLFPAWMRAADGWQRPDLVRWEPATGEERRITRGADLVDVDPHPDGTWAIAVRSYWGAQHLVRVDLQSGAWTPITDPDPDVVFDDPRFHPDGDRVSYLRHRGAAWDVVIRHLDSGAEAVLPLPDEVQVAAPAWTPDGDALLASLGQGGFVEIVRLPLDGTAPVPLTHSRGGAVSPAPTPDGESVFYLALDAEGVDLHRLAYADALADDTWPAWHASAPATAGGRAPVVRPPPPPPIAPPEPTEHPPPRPYGAGRQEVALVAGTSLGRRSAAWTAGLRVGDLIGRSDLLVMGGLRARDSLGRQGATVAWAWRGWPVAVHLQGFLVDEEADLDLARTGAAAGVSTTRHLGTLTGRAGLGAFADVPFADDPTPWRSVGWTDLELAQRLAHRRAWVGWDLALQGQAGLTGGTGFLLGDATAGVELGVAAWSLAGSYRLGRTTGTSDLDRFSLGGLGSGLVPEAWLMSRVTAPALAPSAARGPGHDVLRGRIGTTYLGGSLTRYRVFGTCTALGCADPEAATVAGIEAEADLPPLPLGKIAAVQARAGVGCVLETPDEGWRQRPCGALEHWSAWLGLAWRP